MNTGRDLKTSHEIFLREPKQYLKKYWKEFLIKDYCTVFGQRPTRLNITNIR